MSGSANNPPSPAPGLPVGRITIRPDFLAAARGHKQVRSGVLVQAARSDAAGAGVRAGFTATRKIGGAVQRNRAKRRLREAARQTLPELGRAGCDYVFVARAATPAHPWPALLDDVRTALISLARLLENDGSGQTPRP